MGDSICIIALTFTRYQYFGPWINQTRDNANQPVWGRPCIHTDMTTAITHIAANRARGNLICLGAKSTYIDIPAPSSDVILPPDRDSLLPGIMCCHQLPPSLDPSSLAPSWIMCYHACGLVDYLPRRQEDGATIKHY